MGTLEDWSTGARGVVVALPLQCFRWPPRPWDVLNLLPQSLQSNWHGRGLPELTICKEHNGVGGEYQYWGLSGLWLILGSSH